MERLALSMGDAAGISGEIILKAAHRCLDDVVVYGSYDILDHYNERFGHSFRLNRISDPSRAEEGMLHIIDVGGLKYRDIDPGKVSALCGKHAYLFLERAIRDTLDKKTSAVVSCPLNKEALNLAGYHYAGHTEILADLTGTGDCAMLLWSDTIKTIHVSTHVSLKEAIERVKKERIVKVALLAKELLEKAGIERPKIAVAGLNPHAGEGGLFGSEEAEQIAPAVKELKARGVDACGPIAPDTVFLRCHKGEFDLVVAMYHDQGHIPLKIMDFDDGVNITAGLPIIRTSVDHGTAFDTARKNIADESSLLKAIEIAKRLA